MHATTEFCIQGLKNSDIVKMLAGNITGLDQKHFITNGEMHEHYEGWQVSANSWRPRGGGVSGAWGFCAKVNTPTESHHVETNWYGEHMVPEES